MGLSAYGVGNDIFSHTGYNQPDQGIGGAIHQPELNHGAGLTPNFPQQQVGAWGAPGHFATGNVAIYGNP